MFWLFHHSVLLWPPPWILKIHYISSGLHYEAYVSPSADGFINSLRSIYLDCRTHQHLSVSNLCTLFLCPYSCSMPSWYSLTSPLHLSDETLWSVLLRFGTGHSFLIQVKINRSYYVFPHGCINTVHILPSWWYWGTLIWGTLIVDDKVERILCVSSISVTSSHQLSGSLLPNTVQRYKISVVLHLHQCSELQRSFSGDMANKTDNALEWQRDQTSFSLNKSWPFLWLKQ